MPLPIIDYTINFTNGVVKTPLTVHYGTINNDTSLKIYGRGAGGYGEGLQENMISLLENFCSNSAPVNPTAGQTWFNNISNTLSVYDGTTWIPIGSSANITGLPYQLMGTNGVGITEFKNFTSADNTIIITNSTGTVDVVVNKVDGGIF
jgi:hypothetical protein